LCQLPGKQRRRNVDNEEHRGAIRAAPHPRESCLPRCHHTPINIEDWGTPEAYRELVKPIPYKRIGRAAVWLASDDSNYIRGAGIFVDGGMTRYPGFEMSG